MCDTERSCCKLHTVYMLIWRDVLFKGLSADDDAWQGEKQESPEVRKYLI